MHVYILTANDDGLEKKFRVLMQVWRRTNKISCQEKNQNGYLYNKYK